LISPFLSDLSVWLGSRSVLLPIRLRSSFPAPRLGLFSRFRFTAAELIQFFFPALGPGEQAPRSPARVLLPAVALGQGRLFFLLLELEHAVQGPRQIPVLFSFTRCCLYWPPVSAPDLFFLWLWFARETGLLVTQPSLPARDSSARLVFPQARSCSSSIFVCR
jgi:hypothetical protein